MHPPEQAPFKDTALATTPEDSITYEKLRAVLEKSYRNGNWRRLSFLERALYKGGMQLAMLRGRIVNPSLVDRIKSIISKLVQTPVARILQLGREQASRLLELYSRNGIFKWVPSVKQWLKDPEYLLWLGAKQLVLRNLGYL
ncbi:MAG: hypothetical protein QXG12_07675 [Thermoproteota archaeon]